jgi:predicted nucleic acid-binding protein
VAIDRLLLLDKSAYVQGAAALEQEGELCLCAITRLELLYSARSPSHYSHLEADLDAFRELRIDAETIATARGAQRELTARSQHRVALPDLLVAACAQQHGADVLHRDRHYDALASVLAFEPIRV